MTRSCLFWLSLGNPVRVKRLPAPTPRTSPAPFATSTSLWTFWSRALTEGFRKFFVGVRFPVREGYVYFLRGGGFHPEYRGAGILREGGVLLYTGIVAGIQVVVRFRATVPQHRSPATAGQHRRR